MGVSAEGAARFAATQAEARAAIGAVVGRLARGGLMDDRLGTVEIVLAEVFNNIVEHGYGGDGAGAVYVEFALSPERLNLSVTDRGIALPGGALPPGHPAELDVGRGDLPEGGFGWLLIRELTSGLRYDRHGSCNRLELRFDLGREIG